MAAVEVGHVTLTVSQLNLLFYGCLSLSLTDDETGADLLVASACDVHSGSVKDARCLLAFPLLAAASQVRSGGSG